MLIEMVTNDIREAGMKKSKTLFLFTLLITMSLVGCQSSGQEDISLLKEELASVKAELKETKEALSDAETVIETLKSEMEDDVVDLNEKTEIENTEIKIAAIKASIEELERLIQGSYQNGDLSESLKDFVKRQSIDVSYVYFGSVDDTFTVYPEIELPEDYKITERPVYKEAVNNSVYVAEAYMDFTEDKLLQTISKAVYVNDELIGVIGIDAFID